MGIYCSICEKNIPCLGIEQRPARPVLPGKRVSRLLRNFFGRKLAATLKKADLILGNNVLAHVPDINDFVGGLKFALKQAGPLPWSFRISLI